MPPKIIYVAIFDDRALFIKTLKNYLSEREDSFMPVLDSIGVVTNIRKDYPAMKSTVGVLKFAIQKKIITGQLN